MSTKHLVFIHGMYMTPLCWERWVSWFEKKGYRCTAPGWPGRDAPPPAQRAAHPDPALGALTLTKVLEHLDAAVRRLPEKPVLIGHSMGGLAAQLLLQKGIAAGAVAIDSAPPQGVLAPSWSFVRSNWGHITPFARQEVPVVMTAERFRYTFVHTLDPRDQAAVMERYVVPESRRIPRESLTRTARVDFSAPHAPLLLIAGSRDHIVPASVNRANYRRYARGASKSVITFKEFAGRTHYIIGQEGWEEVAEFIREWMERHLPG
jgi:pimeloyl-ACP methyl ester carboxylesterase